jgi:uncharacterized protein YdhG (YjbR/CyaY superfamily)
MQTYATTNEYLKNFEGDEKVKLSELRELLNSLIKDGTECICYGIPTIKLGKKNIVHFAGFKNHFGIYPGALAVAEFADDLKKYKTSKGAIQIPWTEKLPKALMKKIIKFNLSALK